MTAAAEGWADRLATLGLVPWNEPLPITAAAATAVCTTAAHQGLACLLGAATERGLVTADAITTELIAAAWAERLAVCVQLDSVLLEVTAALAAAGIPVRVLKGVAIATLDEADPAWRSYGDVDVLVPHDRLLAAIDTLAGIGAHPAVDPVGRRWLAAHGKGITLTHPSGMQVDLHRHLATGPFGSRVHMPGLFEQGRKFEIGGTRLTALGDVHRFLHACYHPVLGRVRGPRHRRDVLLMAHTVSPQAVAAELAAGGWSAAVVHDALTWAGDGGGSVTVDWRTAQEVDNLGFNLYAENSDGSLKRLTPDLIISKAPTSVEAQTYQTKVSTRAKVLWLEDVALDGATELHGPYTVGKAYGDVRPPAEINWAAATAQVETVMRGSRQQERRASAGRIRTITTTTATGPVARLEVTQPGVYQLTHAQLLAAGINLTGETAASLAVTDARGAVAIEVLGPNVFGPGSSVRFLGEPLDTLYTGANVYWLHVDPALAKRISGGAALTTPTVTPSASVTTTPRDRTGAKRPTIGTDSGTPSGSNTGNTTATTEAPATTQPAAVVPTTDYSTTAVTEVNRTYSVTAPGSDPWYDQLLLRRRTPASASATVNVTDPVAGQPATASVELWGITSHDVVDEHSVVLSVNGVVVGEARFDDAEAATVTGTIPAGVLLPGANTLQVTLLTVSGVTIDMVAIDSWSIAYRRSNVAVAGRLDLTSSGQRLDVTGMPAGDVVAYRTAADGSVEKVATTWNGTTLEVPGSAQPQRYVLSAAGALRGAVITPLRTPAKLLEGPADYLIITHAALAGSLQPLVNYHTSQGRLVKVVDVADIYDQYSHGVLDAKAIDDYLAKAVPALGVRWVLLAGADSVDYRNYTGQGSFSLIPSLYGRTGTRVTYTPLDPAYADVNGDGSPDVALGRFPARTPAELTLMIDKTLAYANSSPQRTALLASDANDGIDYAGEVDSLAARLAGWTVTRADLDRGGVAAARATLIDAMSSGVGLVYYLGHSGSGNWTESGLFNSYDAAALTGPSSVVVQFGCWNTYYASPDADTLAHALLTNTHGGAAAVLGSTALTNSANDTAFARLLAEQMASGTLSVGEAVVAAKKALLRVSGGDTSDVQLGWTILGDPAIVAGGRA